MLVRTQAGGVEHYCHMRGILYYEERDIENYYNVKRGRDGERERERERSMGIDINTMITCQNSYKSQIATSADAPATVQNYTIAIS